MNHYLVVGSDSGVGKTHIICALLRDLRTRGVSALGVKPLECGNRADTRAIREAAATQMSLEQLNPIYLRAGADPCISAELERRTISADVMQQTYAAVCSSAEVLLLEGVGGWLVPLAQGVTQADAAEKLNLPIILVVGNRPGAVNHTLLTIQDIQRRGLVCRGIILNHLTDDWDSASLTNRKLIEDFTGLPILAELIHGQDELDSSFLSM
ncbi:MAG: dethiobiotin synthase [Akkermansia sp.]|nr:dethiobiotin synthase [Akkermansia sp.]